MTPPSESTSGREAIPEDLEFDPSFSRQRTMARYLIGGLINQLRGFEPMGFRKMSNAEVAAAAEKQARAVGIIATPDGLHHAPACPSNLWSGQMLPFQPCSCGARRATKASVP